MKFTFLSIGFLFLSLFLAAQLKEDFGYFIDKAVVKMYNDPQKSLDFAQSLIINDKNPDKIIYQNVISQTNALKGDYLNSVQTILNKEQINSEKPTQFYVFFMSYCLADQYQNLGLYEQSQKTIFKILENKNFPENTQTEITLSKIMQLQCINYVVTKKYNEAQGFLEKSNAFLKNNNEESEILKIENKLIKGIILIYQKKIDEAQSVFISVLESASLEKYDFLYALARENASRVSFLKQDYSKTDALLLEGLQKIEKTQYFPLKIKIYEALSKSYLAQNNAKQYQYYRSLHENGKENLDENKKSATSYLVNVIEDFNQNELEFYRKNANKKTSLLGYLSFFLVIGSGIFYFLADKKQKDQKKQMDFFDHQLSKKTTTNTIIQESKTIETRDNVDNEPHKTSMLSPEKENELLTKLNEFEQSQLFLSNQMSLPFLAAELDTNIKYLSEIIRNEKAKNFNAYINNLRIKYLVNLLKTDYNYLNYKVSYLAEITGFSSHSAFTAVFKSITGMSPNDFIQQINSQKKL